MKLKKTLLGLYIALFAFSMLNIRVYASTATERLSGQDRLKTAIAISQTGWQASDNVVLATSEDFPDALSAAPLAKQLDAPILLTDKSILTDEVADEIYRLQPKTIFIIGGEGVVSRDIEYALLNSKMVEVIRLQGMDRYETSLSVANYMSSNFNIGKEVVAATGEDFPDALSIAPVAAKKGMPIILTPMSILPEKTADYLTQNDIEKSYIIGGTGVVSDYVMNKFPGAERLWGADRYGTNAKVLEEFAGDIDFSTSYIATGEDFPDALAGSALAPKTSSPIVLTYKNPLQATKSILKDKLSEIKSMRILGGEGVVPTPAINILLQVTKDPLNVSYINVGQADSILIKAPTGETMLIDAGNNADADTIINYLKNQGISQIDVLVGTHPHEDHIGAMDSVIQNFDIGKIYMPQVTATTQTYMDVVSAIQNKKLSVTVPIPGTTFKLGDAFFTILAPNGGSYEDPNNYSIVIKMAYGDTSFLFTGDAEDISESEILSKGYDIKADVLKIGHHGSSSSTTEAFLNKVNPKFAVISVGVGNSYGHPTAETMSRLQNKGIVVYRTDQNGTVVASSDGQEVTFNTKPGNYSYNSGGNTDTSNPGGGPSETVYVDANGNGLIKGNIGSNGKIYHLPGGTYYNRTVAEVWFKTESEAVAAGFRRALN